MNEVVTVFSHYIYILGNLSARSAVKIKIALNLQSTFLLISIH